MSPLRIAFFLLLLGACFNSQAQQIVQTPGDIFILCAKDSQFIGKPLKYLFNEIKPPIRLVLAREGWAEEAPMFTFFFTTMEVYNRYRIANKFPLRLRVYLEKPFKWEYQKRKGYKDKDHYLDWTKDDEEKYGELIVIAIRVAGEYSECDYEPWKDQGYQL